MAHFSGLAYHGKAEALDKEKEAGKKGRKSKGTTIALSDFLAGENDAGAGQTVVMAPRTNTSWADEMENEVEDPYDAAYKERLVLPTAPRSSRAPDIDEDKIPKKPPFTVHLANVAFDIDNEDIENFFHGLSVSSVRIPREGGDTGRGRGFSYVEFEDVHSLMEALSMNDMSLKNRKVRITLAGVQEDNDRRRRGEDRSSDRTLGDWRTGPRDESGREERGFRNGPDDGDGGGGFDRFRERGGGDDFYRGGGGFDRDRGGGGFDRDRGGGGFDRDRGGGGFDRDRGGGGFDRDRGGGGFDRDRGSGGFDRDRGFGDRGMDRGGRREFGSGFRSGDRYGDRGGGGFEDRRDDREYGSRGFSRDFGDKDRDRDRYRRDDRNSREGPPRESQDSRDGRDMDRDQAKERPKLVLQKRTVPLEEAGKPATQSYIFGGAKPVDTAAREREIEERLAKERDHVIERDVTSKDDGEKRHARKSEQDSGDDKDGNKSDSDTSREGRRDHSREYKRDSGESRKEFDRDSRSSGKSDEEEVRKGGAERESRQVDKRSDDGRAEREKMDDDSHHSDGGKAVSPRREDPRAVPAPPPKENVWAKRAARPLDEKDMMSDGGKTIHDDEKTDVAPDECGHAWRAGRRGINSPTEEYLKVAAAAGADM